MNSSKIVFFVLLMCILTLYGSYYWNIKLFNNFISKLPRKVEGLLSFLLNSKVQNGQLDLISIPFPLNSIVSGYPNATTPSDITNYDFNGNWYSDQVDLFNKINEFYFF